MTFDLRLPIGLLFSLFGILLICYGFITPASLYKVSFDINVNLRWGCALLGFCLLYTSDAADE